MAMERCPICGEKYSDTYKYCPFCEEMDAMDRGTQIRRSNQKPGRRAAGKQMSLLTPTLTVLILVMAALLVYLLYGDRIADKLGLGDPANVQIEEPVVEHEEPIPVEPPVVEEQEPVDPLATMDYAAAALLPEQLELSTTDFSLFQVGENHTIRVSGGTGNYRWFSENPAVVTVDAGGKVTALSGGTVNVVVTDGQVQGTCIVRSQIRSGSASSAAPQPPAEVPVSTGLQAGAGKVINAGSGVRVRAQANTDSEILATLSSGADVQIVKSAGEGWYEITFANVGGVTTTGYMKGDYLANR